MKLWAEILIMFESYSWFQSCCARAYNYEHFYLILITSEFRLAAHFLFNKKLIVLLLSTRDKVLEASTAVSVEGMIPKHLGIALLAAWIITFVCTMCGVKVFGWVSCGIVALIIMIVIGSGNGLSSVRYQAITWTNYDYLIIGSFKNHVHWNGNLNYDKFCSTKYICKCQLY